LFCGRRLVVDFGGSPDHCTGSEPAEWAMKRVGISPAGAVPSPAAPISALISAGFGRPLSQGPIEGCLTGRRKWKGCCSLFAAAGHGPVADAPCRRRPGLEGPSARRRLRGPLSVQAGRVYRKVLTRGDVRAGGISGGKKQTTNADVRLMPVATVQGPHAPGPARLTGRLGIAQGRPDTQWHSAT
jgi:hypothetical protein